jgi:hypothetical protein
VSGARLAFASAGGARARGRLLRDPRWLALGVVALVGCGVAAWLALHRAPSADQGVARFLMKPLSTNAGPAVITSDGRTFVYLGTSEGRRMVFVRGIDDFGTRALAGTEDATRVFLSADGKWIAYFSTDAKLKKVPVEGGASTIVAAGFQLGGANWGANDVIVGDFARIDGLSWIHAAGGETHRLTDLDAGRKESRHSDPLVLPDGKAVIFLARTEVRWQSAVGELALVPFDAAATGPVPHVLLGIKSRGAVALVDGWLLYTGEERAT